MNTNVRLFSIDAERVKKNSVFLKNFMFTFYINEYEKKNPHNHAKLLYTCISEWPESWHFSCIIYVVISIGTIHIKQTNHIIIKILINIPALFYFMFYKKKNNLILVSTIIFHVDISWIRQKSRVSGQAKRWYLRTLHGMRTHLTVRLFLLKVSEETILKFLHFFKQEFFKYRIL